MNTIKHLTIIASLFVVCSLRASTPIANEFWISTNATANFITNGVGSGGTIDNPLDGSTQGNFDWNMNNMPTNSTMHILAGTYATLGVKSYTGWLVKSGQKIIGSGIDVTILQLPRNVPQYGPIIGTVVANEAVGIEISDLTLDCNADSTGTLNSEGISLTGNHHAVRRVKVINALGVAAESFCINIGTFGTSIGNIIEECEVSSFQGGGCSALQLAAAAGGSISGIIRNNRVLLNQGVSQFAINGSCVRDYTIDGNYVDGAAVGVYGDTGGSTNVLIMHNTFKNVGVGVDYHNCVRKDITIAFNDIELTNVPTYYAYYALAFNFFPDGAASYTNIFIFKNNVAYSGSSACTLHDFVRAYNATGLTVLDNAADPQLTNYIVNCDNVNIDDNYDIYGNYRYDLNTPTLGGITVTPTGLGLISSQSTSVVLTNLGLPGNPLVLLTNNNATPVALSAGLILNSSGGGSAYLSYTNSAGWPNYGFSSSQSIQGINNNAFGWTALASAQSSSGENNAFGGRALSSLTTGYWNTAFGDSTLLSDQVGIENVAVGLYSLFYTTNSYNTSVGAWALENDTSGSDNNAFGDRALDSDTNGSENVAIGGWSGIDNISGNGNVFIGVRSGPTVNSSYNVLVGTGADVPLPDTGSQMNIGGVIFGNGLKNTDVANATPYAGNIGLFTTNLTGANFTVKGTTLLSGNVTVAGSSISITNPVSMNWAVMNVTPSNAVISVQGVPVAVLQTNGVFNAFNGLSTTISNSQPASVVSLTGIGVAWTNTLPWNIAAYVANKSGGPIDNAYYNGSSIFTNIFTFTVMLKPGAIFSATNNILPLNIKLSWCPF